MILQNNEVSNLSDFQNQGGKAVVSYTELIFQLVNLHYRGFLTTETELSLSFGLRVRPNTSTVLN